MKVHGQSNTATAALVPSHPRENAALSIAKVTFHLPTQYSVN
jgi:hypothetical protein